MNVETQIIQQKTSVMVDAFSCFECNRIHPSLSHQCYHFHHQLAHSMEAANELRDCWIVSQSVTYPNLFKYAEPTNTLLHHTTSILSMSSTNNLHLRKELIVNQIPNMKKQLTPSNDISCRTQSLCNCKTCKKLQSKVVTISHGSHNDHTLEIIHLNIRTKLICNNHLAMLYTSNPIVNFYATMDCFHLQIH